jgi:hypothetical protein
MAGDPLRDLDRTTRIHVLGDTRRTEAVTTNSFQDPACPRPFLIGDRPETSISGAAYDRAPPVDAAIWGMPIVSVDAMREAFFRDAGAKYGDILYFSKSADWKFQTTNPNASSPAFGRDLFRWSQMRTLLHEPISDLSADY